MYSVIIPARNELPHLWYTLHHLKMMWDAEAHGEEHELIVVNSLSTDNTKNFLEGWAVKPWVKCIQTDVDGPGPVRQVGADAAQGDILFFFDAHVLVGPGLFRSACRTLREEVSHCAGSLHFPIAWDGGKGFPMATVYSLTLEKNFWGDNVSQEFASLTEVGAGGHAGLAVIANHFRRVRGYSAPFHNYGGDETYLDLKFALFGYRNYLLPDVYYMHCSQRHQEYTWTCDDVFINNVMNAYIIGGETWSRKVYDHHLAQPNWQPGEAELNRMYGVALREAADDHAFVQKNKSLTLEDVLSGLKARKVPH